MIKICKNYSKVVNAITHPFPHHADEVFATVMLAVLFPVNLFRTRDQDIIDNTDAIVYDAGFQFDPGKKRFDHHQKGFSEARADGTIYSSAGLIWHEYGVDIIKKIDESGEIDDEVAAKAASLVDESLIRGIDASDNGQLEENGLVSVSSVIASLNPLWDMDEDPDECFIEACSIAELILKRKIEEAISSVHGRKVVEKLIRDAKGTVITSDKFINGWVEMIAGSKEPQAKDLLYAIYPNTDGDEWCIQAIPPNAEKMIEQRKPFPENWRGLRGQEFAATSGVESAIFCHKAGFFAATRTKDDAIRLANIASTS